MYSAHNEGQSVVAERFKEQNQNFKEQNLQINNFNIKNVYNCV